MARVGKNVCSVIRKVTSSGQRDYVQAQIAPLQKTSLEERCILVDEHDRPLGQATKRDCHKVGRDGSLLLHRAFSVFLFNGKGDLLMQRRSLNKVTFPDHYSNTCCSHPLAEIEGETVEEDALGVKRAAQRRLSYELGIPKTDVQLSELVYLSRIHYLSIGDGCWGEHEIDYILFLQKNEIAVDPNPDEVSEIQWVSRGNFQEFLRKPKAPLSPWFDLIAKRKLLYWWDNLDSLKKVQDHKVIERIL